MNIWNDDRKQELSHELSDALKGIKKGEIEKVKKRNVQTIIGSVCVVTLIIILFGWWSASQNNITQDIREVIKQEIAHIKEPVRSWKDLDKREQQVVRAQVFILFPFILKHGVRWNPISEWMIQEKNVSHHRIRDIFRNAPNINNLPKIYQRFLLDLDAIKIEMHNLDAKIIKKHWAVSVPVSDEQRFLTWISLLEPHVDEKLDDEQSKEFFLLLKGAL